ncbi:anti-sigma factor family protein [uncultured Jatrophihabitans sp.]|uniref:anti-sigma factor family protein n=1 Tax=uncultured Jatrophihabitans sp. TaxID=1610747 RepID=UPI0035CC7E53
MSDAFSHLDAAYVLGALDSDDLAAFEAHLRTCAACRARVDELRPTVRVLAAARAAGVTAGVGHDEAADDRRADDRDRAGPVPDTLLPGLLRRAGRERRRRRWAVTGIAAVAAACLVTLVVVLWPSSTPSRPAPQALAAVRTTPVHATARLVAKPWGTEIDVRCTYARYAASLRGDYGLRVIDRDHRSHDVGTWSLVPDGTTYFTGGTAVRRERIARVQITLPDGTAILQLTL